MPSRVRMLGYVNIVLVAVLMLALVFGLKLFPRLDAGQRVVDRLKPAFVPARVTGDRAGINYASDVVDLLDPITAAQSTALEVPKLVTLVSAKTGLTPGAVVNLLRDKFPHVLGLLQALPLSAVTDELPGFVQFVAAALKVTPDQLAAILVTSFPHLAQALTSLPKVTNGWNNVPGLTGLTRFNGTPARTAPQLRDYLSGDVVPVIEKNQHNFRRVATYFPPVKYFPPLLTAIGVIATGLGLIMIVRAATGPGGRSRKDATFAWTAVMVLGALVLGLVFGARLYSRLNGAERLMKSARPAFVPVRISGDRAGVNYISNFVDLGDPIMNPAGGAEAEIAELVTKVSGQTGMAPPDLLAVLQGKFPHTVALLQAVPLSKINTELAGVVDLLHVALNVPPAQVVALLTTSVPGLAQSITALPKVVAGWDNYPGGKGLTRFNGTPVKTAPQLRDYFAGDVIGSIAKVAPDFRTLDGTAPALDLFPGLLTILGALLLLYGFIMLKLVKHPAPEEC